MLLSIFDGSWENHFWWCQWTLKFHHRLPWHFSARSTAYVMTQKQFDKCQCNERQSELQVLLWQIPVDQQSLCDFLRVKWHSRLLHGGPVTKIVSKGAVVFFSSFRKVWLNWHFRLVSTLKMTRIPIEFCETETEIISTTFQNKGTWRQKHISHTLRVSYSHYDSSDNKRQILSHRNCFLFYSSHWKNLIRKEKNDIN